MLQAVLPMRFSAVLQYKKKIEIEISKENIRYHSSDVVYIRF